MSQTRNGEEGKREDISGACQYGTGQWHMTLLFALQGLLTVTCALPQISLSIRVLSQHYTRFEDEEKIAASPSLASPTSSLETRQDAHYGGRGWGGGCSSVFTRTSSLGGRLEATSSSNMTDQVAHLIIFSDWSWQHPWSLVAVPSFLAYRESNFSCISTVIPFPLPAFSHHSDSSQRINRKTNLTADWCWCGTVRHPMARVDIGMISSTL